jgi:6,7-dimethyl-8-ribityllumazine synthase
MSTVPSPLAHTGTSLHPRVAFIHAGWHADIVGACREGFAETMAQAGWPAAQLDFIEVPGVFEIPLHARLLASQGQHAAIVAAGFVVDGGIYRHDFVSDAVIQGLMRAQLDTGVPVLSAVLTPHHYHEHAEHHRFFLQHMRTKGVEVAEACMKTIASMAALHARAA